MRAYYDWGFNVAAVDLRSFGAHRADQRRALDGGLEGGGGHRRGRRYLKELGATSVGALGISLGGSSVLPPPTSAGAEEALDGGILAICAPADTRRAAERLSRQVPRHPPRLPDQQDFAAMLRSRVRDGPLAGRDRRGLVEPIEALVGALLRRQRR